MANLIRVKQLDQPDLSGFFNDAFINTGIFDATFVDKFTDQNISGIKTFVDGVNLNNVDNLSFSGVDISIISGNIALTNRPTVNGTGVLLSGEVASLPAKIVYITGDQTISGIKTFVSRPTVNGTGVLLSGEAAALPTTIVYTTGDQTISGNKTFINDINISGTGSFQGINILNLNELILSGAKITILGDSGVHSSTNIYISGNPLITGVDLSSYATTTNLASSGSNLVSIINSLSGTLTGNYGTITNLASTGNTLTSRVNSLSGSSVLIIGNQLISGVKTFATGVNISGHVGIGIDNNNFDLYVRKSPAGVTVSPDVNSIAVFEGSGNSHITILASNAQSAGVVLGSPADNFGAYLTWNYDNHALKLGTDKPSGFIQILTDDERVAVTITSGANVGIGATSPSEKLEVNGNVKVSGNLTVNNTGVLLSGSTPFVMNFGHTRNSTTTAGSQYYYFSAQGGDMDAVSLANNDKRRVQIMQNCFLRRVTWASMAKTNVPTPSNAITGYFKNFGTGLSRDDSAGVQVTPAINIPVSNIMYNISTGDLNIPIASGDYVSFYYQTNFNAGSSNLASGLGVNVYAYFYV